MTIVNHDAFKASRPAGFDGTFDWDYLLPAFEPTRIQPMDFDGVVERCGRFLVYETKAAGKVIPLGQCRALDALLRLNRQAPKTFTVFHLEGKSWTDLVRFTYHLHSMADGFTVSPVTPEYVVAMTRAWFVAASGKQIQTDAWWSAYDRQVLRGHKPVPLRTPAPW